jgi:hypothetical protein
MGFLQRHFLSDNSQAFSLILRLLVDSDHCFPPDIFSSELPVEYEGVMKFFFLESACGKIRVQTRGLRCLQMHRLAKS